MQDFSDEYNSLLEEYKTRLAYCLDAEKFNEALEQMYSLLLNSDDVLKEELKSLYIETLKRFYESMRENVAWNEIFHYWEQSLQLYPDCIYLNHQLGLLLMKAGVPSKAAPYFHKAHLLDPTELNVKIDLENLKNNLVERWHFVMLNDFRRNQQFKGAIESAIKDGFDSVLDIGAGSGILSMCAAIGGAREVYACELSATMYDIGQAVLKINNLNQSIHLIEKCSVNMTIPENIPHRVSLVVTETFDAGLLGENILSTVDHAWKHLLLPPGQGKIIPERATVFCALIECPYIRKKSWFQGNRVGPLNLSHIRLLQKEAKDDPYMTEKISFVGGFSYLSNVQPLCHINFNDPKQIAEWHESMIIDKLIKITSHGHLDALVIWFELDLGYGYKIATSPDDITCWEQAAFPILPCHMPGSDLRVKDGEHIEIKIECLNHFYLRSVKRPSTSHHDKSSYTDIILPGEVIQRLNNNYYLSFHLEALKNIPWSRKLTVLDLSSVPWMGLVAYKLGAKRVTMLKNDATSSIKELMGRLGIPKDSIQFDDPQESEPKQHNVILFDPIMGTGVTFYPDPNCYLTKHNNYLVPKTLPFFACLINSRDLLLMSKVVDDNNTLGFKIAELINLYQTNVQQDIIFSTLPHTKLSNTINLGPIPFTEKKVVSTFRIKPSNLGAINGVAFWFGEEGAFGSQSIYLLNEELIIESLEENIVLEYILEHCYLEFSIKKA